jgi:hypothetical protein
MTPDAPRRRFDHDLNEVADRLNSAIRRAANGSRGLGHFNGPDLPKMVELRGIEPLTFSMRTRRATNCAIAPSTGSTGYQCRSPARNPNY